MKIAVIGSGISGLSAAHFLSKKHIVDLFEKNDHFGGHSYTVEVSTTNEKNLISLDLGFIVFNKKNYNVKIDCITISKKQFLFTKERIRKSRLTNKVNVMMMDYRDVAKKYDVIVSIEMIEAVGEKYLNQYFDIIKRNLAPGGRGAIQSIVIKDDLYNGYRTREDFIQKYIFPGGFLPSLKSLSQLSENSGLKIENYEMYGNHYSNTLQKWRESFLNSWDIISRQGFDISFKKMWDFYFSYCDAGFKSKNINVVQFSLCNK